MSEAPKLDRRGWPKLLTDMAEVAGDVPALRLVEARGGQRVYIPQVVYDGHWLAQVMGLDAAKLLCERYGREELELPNLGKAKSKKRLIAAHSGSARQAAAELGVTLRRVRQVRAEQREPTLFDD